MTVKNRPKAAGKQPNRLPSLPAVLSTAAIVAGIAILCIAWSTSAQQNVAVFGGGGSGYEFAVGAPGPGKPAPGFTLPATDGGEVSLSDYVGQYLLLYFHEGGECQSCWDQIGDIEGDWADFEAAGIDAFLPVTTDPIELHTQKMVDEGLNSIAVSDPDLVVSEAYGANAYGKMSGTANGHSLILVDGEGTIVWRADYGGEPDYTMYLPTDGILADLDADRIDQ